MRQNTILILKGGKITLIGIHKYAISALRNSFFLSFFYLKDQVGKSFQVLKFSGWQVGKSEEFSLSVAAEVLLDHPTSVYREGALRSQNCLHYNETIIVQHQSQHQKYIKKIMFSFI